MASATGLFVLTFGRLAAPGEADLVRIFGVGFFILCLLIVLFGWKIERTLEYFFWASTIFQMAVLLFIFVAIAVTGEALSELGRGFVSFGYIPKGIDIFLLAGWWAYIAYASGQNYIISNFYRDKGYAMGHVVGYIPAMIGGKKVPVSPRGKTFKISPKT